MKRCLCLFLLALAAASGCIEEPVFVVDGNMESALKDGFLTVDFGHDSFDDITISTRSTVPTAAEDAIVNLYAIMFDSAGNRIYGRYFNLDVRKTTLDDLTASTSDCWYVNNLDSGEEVTEADKEAGITKYATNGVLKMKAPSVEKMTGGRLYLFANIDPVMLNLSVEKLNLIKTEVELQAMSLKFNQESTSRTGNLLMIGSADIVVNGNTVSYEPDSYYAPSGSAKIFLERIDSKIEVNIAVVPGAETKKYDEYGNLVSTQVIDKFVPTSWRVVNLPKDSWFLERDAVKKEYEDRGVAVPSDVAEATKEGGYFDSSAHLFDTEEIQTSADTENYRGDGTSRTVHGFSFYMLESYPKRSDVEDKLSGENLTTTTEFNQRDKRVKDDATGEYSAKADGNIWEYAPKNAAYLVIEGEVQMKVNEEAAISGKAQTLNALVTYYVHLGNFGKSTGNGDNASTESFGYDNYDVVCNTHYTYNINIKGVESIEVEVVEDNSEEGWREENERQSGATGEVYIAQEEIYTFDAHYGQRVFRFKFDAILGTLGIKVENGEVKDYNGALGTIADELTWYVSSPFGREGTPDIVNGNVEVPNGLDYKWVYFLVNDIKDDGTYNQNNQWYPGPFEGKVIDVERNREQKTKGKTLMDVSQLCNYLRKQIANKALNRDNDFDSNGEIYVTAFVDEYFYDADPISGEVRDNLWHEFVNKPMRMMHILCSANVSRDGESSATGSVVTIRQRSIQTVYNTENAEQGWGCETVDEIRNSEKGKRGSLGFFEPDAVSGPNSKENEDIRNAGLINDSQNNGLYNTVRLWGLIDSGNTFKTNVLWNQFLEYNRKNDFATTIGSDDVVINFMNDTHTNLRYSCMMRNRDNSGEGVVDENEIRWYLASTEQLITLYLGDFGLSGEARLYNLEEPKEDDFRRHVISSTAHSETSINPERVWAEEGCSIGPYYKDGDDVIKKVEYTSVRCVRNFSKLESSGATNEGSYPKSPVAVTKFLGQNNEVSFRFDFSDLNDASKRIKVYEELIPLDENSEMAHLYDGFETGALIDANIGGSAYNTKIKDELIKGFSYCPEGYRMPNVREAAVMQHFINTKNIEDVTQSEIDTFWGNSFYAVSTYFSFGANGKRWYGNKNDTSGQTWWYDIDSFSVSNDGTRDVRCVRDIDP